MQNLVVKIVNFTTLKVILNMQQINTYLRIKQLFILYYNLIFKGFYSKPFLLILIFNTTVSFYTSLS